jgi:uncharacterized protein YjcR
MKIVWIAREMGISASTVRRWKSDQGWEKKRSEKKTLGNKRSEINARKRRRKEGGQPGNQNGKGGPSGNLKAVTHGESTSFYESVLSAEEMEAYKRLLEQDDEKRRLQTLYAQHQMTERKLMAEIAAIEGGAEMIIHRVVSQIEPSGKKAADGREITKVVKISQEQETRKEQLRNFTDALTRVRAEMRRTADSLHKLVEAEAGHLEARGTNEDAFLAALKEQTGVWDSSEL